MFSEYLDGPIQWQRLDGVTSTCSSGCFEEGIVDGLFRCLDYGEKER
jgi:hypothetical protein